MEILKGQVYRHRGKSYTVLEVRDDKGIVVVANYEELKRFEIPRERMERLIESRDVRLRYTPPKSKAKPPEGGS